MKLYVRDAEDRLTVAAILIKNGYRVRQARVKREGAKSYDYFIEADVVNNEEDRHEQDN